jgi:dihydrofolate reductase
MVIASEWMSLDGVAQAPAYPDEDVSGGFRHGGWHVHYFEDRSMRWVVENVTQAGGYLLGRGTYEMFAAHWPNAAPPRAGSEEEQLLARALNTLPKYVASRTLKEPLAWSGSTLLGGDAAEAVAALKRGAASICSRSVVRPGAVASRPRPDRRDSRDDRPRCPRRRQAPVRR